MIFVILLLLFAFLSVGRNDDATFFLLMAFMLACIYL